MYNVARCAGRYLEIRRTDGISTTHLIDRMLSVAPNVQAVEFPLGLECCALTARRIAAFSAQGRASVDEVPQGELVYIDGDFDMFHGGHVNVLEAARCRGAQLLVGVHSSASVRDYRGHARPVMSSGERALTVLACRHVDDIVFDAPLRPDLEFFRALHVSLVLRVSGHKDFASDRKCEVLHDRWSAAEQNGLLSDFTIDQELLVIDGLIQRVIDSESQLQERQVHKRGPVHASGQE